jgi:hypothetical protein
MNSYLPRMLCISIALAIFLAGCGADQVAVNTQPAQSVSASPTQADSPTPVPTPGPLPSDIVVYPGAQLVVSQRITTGILYFYRSSAPLEAVTSFYTDQMPRQGWTQASAELNGNQGNFLVYIKDTRSVMLNIVPDPVTPGQTDISITLSNN